MIRIQSHLRRTSSRQLVLAIISIDRFPVSCYHDTPICASVMANNFICYISHTLQSDSNPVASAVHRLVPARSSHFISFHSMVHSPVRCQTHLRHTDSCHCHGKHFIRSFHIRFSTIQIQSHLRCTNSRRLVLAIRPHFIPYSTVRFTVKSQLRHTDLCLCHGKTFGHFISYTPCADPSPVSLASLRFVMA
ncbi:hypothetical protein AB205_0116740 [Aquarana catesbeiana]|uniref:Uncharacterized protein n=1 Tax=Aquarana catesbeiana TaxID=8400 RepID=A0A2G9S250_AQUCT|nr:hypothetical protein AB205_0116740 [Aquarana catesbeiana]